MFSKFQNFSSLENSRVFMTKIPFFRQYLLNSFPKLDSNCQFFPNFGFFKLISYFKETNKNPPCYKN